MFDSVCFLGGGGEDDDFCEEEGGSFVYDACCILGFVKPLLLTVMCQQRPQLSSPDTSAAVTCALSNKRCGDAQTDLALSS